MLMRDGITELRKYLLQSLDLPLRFFLGRATWLFTNPEFARFDLS
jgi:hypothetical protein